MSKTVIRFGLIAGLILAVFICVSIPSFRHCGDGSSSMLMNMFVGYTVQLLAFSLIFMAIKQYRDRGNGGVISFGKAFRLGLWISLIGSAFYVVTWAVVYHYFIPDFMDNYSAAQLRSAEKHGVSSTELAAMKQQMAEMKQVYGTWWGFAGYTLCEILPTGLLVSLIAALVLRRRVRKEVAVAG